MAVEVTRKPLPTDLPTPEQDASAGRTQNVREMEMGVTPRKGAAVEIHKYIREDR